jgi:hypothetical protein
MSVKTISLALEFAGLVLPIARDEHGRDVVPIKPITELFGLDWMTQYKKVQDVPYRDHLGTCIGFIPYAGQRREMVCIRVDRVAAYLYTVNPERVRAGGNEAGADYLARKWREWADVLHAYEQKVGMFASAGQRSRHVRDYLAVMREHRSTQGAAQRAQLAALADRLAGELELPHQVEIAGQTT